MISHSYPRTGAMRELLPILLVLVLASCASNNSPRSGQVTGSTPHPTTTNQQIPLSLNKAPVFADTSGLHIQSADGLQCPLRKVPMVPQGKAALLAPSDALVLAKDSFSYSEDEVQQMKDYVNSIFNKMDSITTSYSVSPPSTLRWVPGSSTCSITLQVSNTGNTPVQIGSLGVQLTQPPQPNTYKYRAVDVCYLTGALCGALGGAGDCSAYSASIDLDQHAASHTIFAVKPDQSGDMNGFCPPPTLQPGETVYFHVDLHSPGSQQHSVASYIYSVVPVVTVVESSGSRTLTLPSMAGTVAFVDGRQVPCYGLMNQDQDTTFVPIDINASVYGSLGCLS